MVARKKKTAKSGASKKKRPVRSPASGARAGAKLRAYGGKGRVGVPRLDELFEIRPEPGPSAKMVAAIRQNAILLRMQEIWNRANVKERLALLNELLALREFSGDELIGRYIELGRENGTLRGDADIKHVYDDWFGGGYFNGPVIETMIAGSIVAGQRSLETGLEIVLYWVAAAGERVKVAVAESAQQITLLLMTPSRPKTSTPVTVLEKAEPFWVVVPDADGTGVEVERVYATALDV